MRKNTIFTGSAVAIITPFTKDGVDFPAFEKLIERQIALGTQCIVVCGTTGEPATMTAAERESVVRFCIEHTNGRIPVVVGTGSNCTVDAVKNSENAQKWGADGLLVVTPYYNKCSPMGLKAHYKAISDAVTLPIIAYSVPSRTGVNISASLMAELAQIENVAAIKEASGNMDQVVAIAHACGDAIDIYSGEDALTVPMMSMGAKGVISVAANIVPCDVQAMCSSALAGNFEAAAAAQKKLYPLIKALFCEVNPIPVKSAAAAMGLCSSTLRLPLTEMAPENLERLISAMRQYGVI
mgnify:FL=1